MGMHKERLKELLEMIENENKLVCTMEEHSVMKKYFEQVSVPTRNGSQVINTGIRLNRRGFEKLRELEKEIH